MPIVLPKALGPGLGGIGIWLAAHGIEFSEEAFTLAGQSIGSINKFVALLLVAFVLAFLPNSQQLVAFAGMTTRSQPYG